MALDEALDSFLAEQAPRAHRSDRRLAGLVREAYPIGVPALIMKSSTDRLGESAGYAFHLGTPDELLRRIASWLLTNAGDDQRILLRLVSRLWARHGREDVALAALLLANLDHAALGVDPWVVLASSTRDSEPAEALLLSIEELLRAGRKMPSEEALVTWCDGRAVDGHMALLVSYAGTVRGHAASERVLRRLSSVKVPDGDSLLGRVMQRLQEEQAQD
jgi:hypothetical protein